MRSSALLLIAILAFAAGCGGRTNAVLGDFDGGTSSGGSSGSSGASSSGASSSGASSGSSSGGSSGSSGGSSGSSSGGSSTSSGGSSGSSSGGPSCEPLPGCNSSFECPSPDSCGVCFCENGDWICQPDSVDSGSQCPSAPPFSGESCSRCQTYSCGYASDAGCGETCTCEGGTWECFSPPCPPPPPPICPEFPPSSGTACFGVGSSCFYDTDDGGLCQDTIECFCDPSGTFDCVDACFVADSGPPDTGPPFDAGPPDSGPCPESVPFGNSPCPDDGLVCSYFLGCETNCLCAQNSWVCATQGGSCGVFDE